MSKLRNFFSLLWLSLKVMCRNFVEFARVIRRYYKNFLFCYIDLVLKSLYFFYNPYRVSRRFLQSRHEENVYVYGETPLTTLDLISTEAQIDQSDVVYELGCGRGRGCFWLSAFKRCQVIGVDFVPLFIQKANRIKVFFNLTNIEFIESDYNKIDFSRATVIYLYGSNLSDEEILRLISTFKKLPVGTRVITVSYSLVDYQNIPIFSQIKTFEGKFTWGTADVYLQVKC